QLKRLGAGPDLWVGRDIVQIEALRCIKIRVRWGLYNKKQACATVQTHVLFRGKQNGAVRALRGRRVHLHIWPTECSLAFRREHPVRIQLAFRGRRRKERWAQSAPRSV